MRISVLLLPAILCFSNGAAVQEITLEIRDFATLPMTGKVDGKGQIMGLLARVNFMREEPGGTRNRVFVNDLNGPLYILDKQTGKFTTYLNFNGRDGQPGLFHRLPTQSGFANGFISFAFDPDYARNGKFYTIHLEDPEAPGRRRPITPTSPACARATKRLPRSRRRDRPCARPCSSNGPTPIRKTRPSKAPRAN